VLVAEPHGLDHVLRRLGQQHGQRLTGELRGVVKIRLQTLQIGRQEPRRGQPASEVIEIKARRHATHTARSDPGYPLPDDPGLALLSPDEEEDDDDDDDDDDEEEAEEPEELSDDDPADLVPPSFDDAESDDPPDLDSPDDSGRRWCRFEPEDSCSPPLFFL
jgi:hypothetical protein